MLWVLKKHLDEHPKHMFKLMDKKIITISRKLFFLNWPYDRGSALECICALIIVQGYVYQCMFVSWVLRVFSSVAQLVERQT